MSSDGGDDEHSSSIEGAERTPKDQQASGPPAPEDLLPKGPPPPLPFSGGPMPRLEPADPEVASDDSRPEQRWPVLADGRRLQGPHMPSDKFEDSPRSRTRSRSRPSSSSSPTMARADSSDSASGPDIPPAPAHRDDARDHEPMADDDGAEESGSWSDTSLDLASPALAQGHRDPAGNVPQPPVPHRYAHQPGNGRQSWWPPSSPTLQAMELRQPPCPQHPGWRGSGQLEDF